MARSVPVRAAAMAVVTGVLVAGVSACGADASDDTHPDHRSFALHGRTLTVDSDDSALEVVADGSAKSGTVEVTRWFQGSVVLGGSPAVRWSFKDDRLVLRVHCSGFIADCSARHRIVVPRGISVKVDDADGSVRAQGFRDPLSVDTADGAVHVTDSSGPLDLRSADGAVHADVSSRQVKADSSDGSVYVRLSAVPDQVDASSADGAVTVALPKGAYRLSAGSDDGGVSVSVPRDDTSPHRVSAHSADGKVTVRTGK
ncbi:DUF4097 family beta strand repeat-containing protein [Streptomyces roseochromogenus]|uniref:DUF4097 domain-containing protein n=1 Tax=Streptomyces roseochromogenus subsp. oscitans DS 12.976 TaxID=1352936 RepID=V6K4W4_STRRC|nr:DUF4097 family beta strand repeat-containing protein [Streptomyces roseochromogenus]EST24004.1 hypothetical protein M878_32055 [Streptomyces roseochromogenus subsp. oscitans DS 12.976]